MIRAVPIHVNSEHLGPEHAFVPVNSDWYARPLPNWGEGPIQAAYRFGLFNNVLSFEFRCSKPAHCQMGLPVGQFQAGLWQMDVAEFFVGTAQDTVYQEFNLSPAGAWWSAVFSDYRKDPQEIDPSEISVTVLDSPYGPRGWQARLDVNLNRLAPVSRFGKLGQDSVDWTQVRLGVTAILTSEEPNATPIYLSSGPLVEAEPDFHRSDQRSPICFVLGVSQP